MFLTRSTFMATLPSLRQFRWDLCTYVYLTAEIIPLHFPIPGHHLLYTFPAPPSVWETSTSSRFSCLSFIRPTPSRWASASSPLALAFSAIITYKQTLQPVPANKFSVHPGGLLYALILFKYFGLLFPKFPVIEFIIYKDKGLQSRSRYGSFV